jgi:energy-coupling factor transport system ATP-binding protein
MIKIENVSFQYRGTDTKVLDNLNLEIQEGEIIAIVGKNGCGKSTLGKLIAGILPLKQGSITIDELDSKNKKKEQEIRNKIGIVFQNPENQIVFSNIKDEISFALKGLSREEINNRVQQALEKVDMLQVKEQDLYNLSLGQKQRVMIAEILAKNPKYIILDEPTTMIDSLGKDKIYQIIKSLKQQGYTLICITNLADEILLADRTLILENGNLVAEIKKEELVNKAREIEKHDIKLPTLLEILCKLNEKGKKINLQDYTVEELVEKL